MNNQAAEAVTRLALYLLAILTVLALVELSSCEAQDSDSLVSEAGRDCVCVDTHLSDQTKRLVTEAAFRAGLGYTTDTEDCGLYFMRFDVHGVHPDDDGGHVAYFTGHMHPHKADGLIAAWLALQTRKRVRP